MTENKELQSPEWSWKPCENPLHEIPKVEPYKEDEKLLTVIMWDASYREEWIEHGLRCLEKQTIRDKVDFIWIEWTDKPNPIVLKSPIK